MHKALESAMSAWLARWGNVGLAGRLLGVTLALLLVIQAAVFWVVRGAITEQAQAQIAQELAVGERVWRRVLAQNITRLHEGAVLLASNHGFRTAMARGSVPSMEAALDAEGRRLGAQITALFDARLQLRATNPFDEVFLLWLKTVSYPQMDKQPVKAEDTLPIAGVLQQIARQAASEREQATLALIGHAPYQFVMAPIRIDGSNMPGGWVLMGFPLDQALADDMYRLFSLHLAVLSAQAGHPPDVVVSTLPAMEHAALAAMTPQQAEARLEGETYMARHVALPTLNGEVRTVLLRSYDDAVAPFRRLQWLLASITLLALLLFGWTSARAMRRVTRPLHALLEAAQALEHGRFDARVDTGRGRDEVSRLARGFDTMRRSLVAQQNEIRRQAYRDRLTGLPNRQRFAEAMEEAIAQSRGSARTLAVITLNLDRFKHVNEVLGYAFGDQLLKAAAERLRALLAPQGNLVARVGGDEFGLLLADATAEQALDMARRVAHAFEAPLAFNDQTVDLSAAMGVACWPADADDADTLISRSEMAMRAAKQRTSGVQIYTAALDSGRPEILSLLSDLRHALAHGELQLYLQPKVALGSAQVVAAEALVRWTHPERGLLPPLQFIPFAEQTGFVRQITLWVLEEAARLWAELQRTGTPLRMAVNLSTRDLLDPDFPDRVATLLARHGTPAAAFCLEITESAMMDEPQRAETTLNKLAALGFKLSIDDFGTGYSSLAYLRRLPVHELKIDRSFVSGMDAQAGNAQIVRSTIDLAHNLGLRVVAEGVEGPAVYALLQELRCDEAQGYFISPPLPAADFAAWHADWTTRQRQEPAVL